jgi:hypothetical protein
VRIPKAFAHQTQFFSAVARAVNQLGPQVLSVTPTLGTDWSGVPAVFFLVVLADAVSRGDQLLNATNLASTALIAHLQPLEQWDVIPYFNYRSQSEQVQINQRSVA